MVSRNTRKCQLWEKILPTLKFNLVSLAAIDTPRTLARKNRVSFQ